MLSRTGAGLGMREGASNLLASSRGPRPVPCNFSGRGSFGCLSGSLLVPGAQRNKNRIRTKERLNSIFFNQATPATEVQVFLQIFSPASTFPIPHCFIHFFSFHSLWPPWPLRDRNREGNEENGTATSKKTKMKDANKKAAEKKKQLPRTRNANLSLRHIRR